MLTDPNYSGRISVTSLKTNLSLNDSYDFGDYSDQVTNCTSLFEGVYTYGCPKKNTMAGFAECDAFEDSIDTTVANIVAQDFECKDDGEDCGRFTTFRMYLFRNFYNPNIFKIRKGSESKIDCHTAAYHDFNPIVAHT